jgi:hypothetical protein
MGDCCSPAGAAGQAKKAACPGHGGECAAVSVSTIVHHLETAWAWRASAVNYYFCEDPDCAIVYFGDDGSTIEKSRLRTPVGVKEKTGEALLCYCFGVSRADFAKDPATREFVVAQTRAGVCSCVTRNPSGRCCLKDFPKPGG